MKNVNVKISLIILIISATMIGFILSYALYPQARIGKKINERWQTTNKIFNVRVTAYAEENGGFVAGAYYVFQSAAAGSNNWREIMTFRHDDPVPIPREQVRFLSDRIGYCFMVYKYAITTDSGKTWSAWDIVRDLQNWRDHQAAIRDVDISSDGTGIMSLMPFTEQPNVAELHTKDYGRHWSVE